MAFPTFPTVGSTIKALWSGSTARARLNMTRFRALHGPAITSMTLSEEDHNGKKTTTGKQPYAIALANRRLMGMAGLWETWRSPA